MRRLVIDLAAVAIASGCMVPSLDLDGKQCPCAGGYTCDTASNTCVRGGIADAGADGNGDGPSADASPASCIAGTPGALLYGTAFTQGNLQWTEPIGDWGVVTGEAVQSDPSFALAYAYPDQTATETDYRVTAKLRQLDGDTTDSVGVLLRAQTTSTGHYSCSWAPNTGAFAMEHTSTTGAVTPIMTVDVDLGSITGYLPTDPQVLDARAAGTQLECCLRGLPTARVTADDNRYTTGGPGFRTAAMSAAFDDLAINGP
jgi:hypothetical protein